MMTYYQVLLKALVSTRSTNLNNSESAQYLMSDHLVTAGFPSHLKLVCQMKHQYIPIL